MRYKQFNIRNYKGIKNLTLDISILPDEKIYTLVGLNESGKTTILEAINDFRFEVEEDFRHLLIPKQLAGGFTGNTEIKATLELTTDDKNEISEYVKSILNISTKNVSIDDTVEITRVYNFENSNSKTSSIQITNFIKIKKREGYKYLSDKEHNEIYANKLKNMLPDIIYYRDFLSKFPEKIFLEYPANSHKSIEMQKDIEYLKIIEDILTSINPQYNLKDHLLDRIKNPTEQNKVSLEAVLNEIGGKVTEVVFNAWGDLINNDRKEIIASTDTSEGRPYLKLNLKDSKQTFSISERSLGFRWFFTFLLYTEFRKERFTNNGEILFLLDEPASNLHQERQKSLLGTFSQITTKSRLIYTTHSHHLICEDWLNSTYVVKNKGLDLSNEFQYVNSQSEIEAYKYKHFVSQYPSQTAYFQPILDVLNYKPGALEYIPNVVILEGKFDFYTLKYFYSVVENRSEEYLHFFPGMGAGKLDLPIGLYESWARPYLVLLDDDSEGQSQKTRYIDDISDSRHIFTYADIDDDFKNKNTENLFGTEEKLHITREFNSNADCYEKSSFNTGIQTLFHEKRIPDYISDETKGRFRKIFNFLNEKMRSA